MSKKNIYVPPAAELILMRPCEALAAMEWKFGFGHTWKNSGLIPAGGELASGIANFGDITDSDYLSGGSDSFFTKPTGTN